MRENAKSAAGASAVLLDEEFAALERLPAPVRRQLHEGNIVISAQDALMLVRMLGTPGAMRALAARKKWTSSTNSAAATTPGTATTCPP